MIAKIKRKIRNFLLLCSLLAISWMVYYAYNPLALPLVPYQFTVKSGNSLRSVARQLANEGLLRHPWSFVLLVRLIGKPGELKAGNYELETNITPLQLMHKITRGDVSQSEVAFIEGWTFRQMRQAL